MEGLKGFRDRILDLWVMGSAVGAIVLGLIALYYCGVYLQITSYKPYMLYLFLISLGLVGAKYYLKEVDY